MATNPGGEALLRLLLVYRSQVSAIGAAIAEDSFNAVAFMLHGAAGSKREMAEISGKWRDMLQSIRGSAQST